MFRFLQKSPPAKFARKGNIIEDRPGYAHLRAQLKGAIVSSAKVKFLKAADV